MKINIRGWLNFVRHESKGPEVEFFLFVTASFASIAVLAITLAAFILLGIELNWSMTARAIIACLVLHSASYFTWHFTNGGSDDKNR